MNKKEKLPLSVIIIFGMLISAGLNMYWLFILLLVIGIIVVFVIND